MKQILVLTLSIFTLFGCESNGTIPLSVSSGNINNLSVVVDNDLWEGSIGESIRNVIGAPLYGLPQDEPLFTMRQMPTVVFSDFARRNRTVLKMSQYHQKLVITQNISLALKITEDMEDKDAKYESQLKIIDRITDDINKHLTVTG